MSVVDRSRAALPKMLTATEVCDLCRFSKKTLERKVADGTFPARHRLVKQRRVWKTTDVLAWIETQREESHKGDK